MLGSVYVCLTMCSLVCVCVRESMLGRVCACSRVKEGVVVCV